MSSDLESNSKNGGLPTWAGAAIMGAVIALILLLVIHVVVKNTASEAAGAAAAVACVAACKTEGYGASTPAGSLTQGYFAEGFRAPLKTREGVESGNNLIANLSQDFKDEAARQVSLDAQLREERQAAFRKSLQCDSDRDYSNQGFGWLDRNNSGNGFEYRSEGLSNDDRAMTAALGGL